jgi:spermidine dehydrogenase
MTGRGTPDEGEELSSKDGITRRDFLDGVAIGAAGLAAAAAAPYLTGAEAALAATGVYPDSLAALPPGYYPPSSTGITGEPDTVVKDVMRLDPPAQKPKDIHSTKEGHGITPQRPARDVDDDYDCVIVGAGASGLASAKFYLDRFGPNKKILLLDQLPDFGGNSHRNEFHIPDGFRGNQDTMILRNGGTVNLDSIGTWNKQSGGLMDIPASYGQPAVDMLSWAGVDYTTATLWQNGGAAGIPSSFGLRQMLLFPAAEFGGTDKVIQSRTEPNTQAGWTTFMGRTPYSDAAKTAIIRIQTENTDVMTAKDGPLTQAEKVQRLTQITYKQYLQYYWDCPDDAFHGEYWRGSGSLLGAGGQAVSAADCWVLGRPGFPAGLGLPDTTDVVFAGIGRTPQQDSKSAAGPTRAWPDGNISLLKLIVSKLIPDAQPDVNGVRPTQLTVLNSKTNYAALDLPANTVRIRLRSTVYNVVPSAGSGQPASVEYVATDKKGNPQPERVRAKHVVMACWNRVTARLVQGLPSDQVENLCYARKVPLIYGRAGLNNWQAWADAHVSSISPRGTSLFWDTTSVAAGAGFGPTGSPVYGPTPNQPPSSPAILTFQVIPNKPDAIPQLYAYESGRQMLLDRSFDDLENELWDVIHRVLGTQGGNFDPARDVNSLMINRWNYGYAHELSSCFDASLYGPWVDQPHRKGCVPFRNVSIANSDSESFAYTHSAINEGYRAVNDLPA